MADIPYENEPPHEDDLRHDGLEYDPAVEPRKALAWLNLLEESERAFEDWNDHCDNIDERYGNLARLCNMSRAREFQMFWANAEVLKPAIYARPPVPVVVTKFKDRRPVYQAAAELLERCSVVAFDMARINDVMLQIRDDLALIGRGVPWVRYEGSGNGYGGKGERICIDFKHRRDFLHSLSRCWYEVSWVAAASYLTRSEARERFHKHSGDAYQEAEYKVDKESRDVGGADERERAQFWEIWHKTEKRVVWVACGVEDILDEGDPHLDIEGFFPCPQPAYGTCQRGSLVPVPDILQYKDQLDEVDLLTARIHALSDAITVKGFYPSGGGEIAEAVLTAMKNNTPGTILVPIANWAAFGGTREVIIWLPIEEIAQTVKELVALRKEIIADIYQIMGLSDIMRGATDARETLGAQELKTQYGSTRIRDKQNEMVRLARDLVAITADVMLDKFKDETLIEMSQTQLLTADMQRQQVGQLQMQAMMLTQQMQQLASSGALAQAPAAPQGPPGQQPTPGQPDPQQQQQQQVQGQLLQLQTEIQRVMNEPSIEQVLTFLHDHRARVYTLDIETDSTIMPDENAEKERRTEFVGMLGNLLPQLAQMIAADPMTAEFCGEVLKFSTAAFRAGRSLDGAIDNLVELMKAKGQGPKGDDPQTATGKIALQIEGIKDQRERDKNKADAMLKAQEIQMRDAQEKLKIQSNHALKVMEIQSRQGDAAAKAQQLNLKAMHDRESHQADMIKTQQDMRLNAQKAAMQEAAAQAKQADMVARQSERRAAMQFKQQSQSPFGA